MSHWSYKAIFSSLALVLILCGCRPLDDDSLYAPKTQAAFFLVQDITDPNLRSIGVIVDSLDMVPDWQLQFGLANADLADMAGYESTLWLSNTTTNEILQIDLQSETLTKTYSTQGVTPDLMVQGEDYLLFADQSTHRMGFLNLKNEEIYFVEMDSAAVFLKYNSGKYYIVGNSWVSVFSETALTAISTEYTDTPIAQCVFNKTGDLVIMACANGDCKQYVVDGSGNIFTAASPQNRNYQRIALSPFFKQQYGREHLEDLRWFEQTLNLEPIGATDVTWFGVDFFEGVTYFQTDSFGSMFSINMNTSGFDNHLGFRDALTIKDYYYIDYEAN